MICTTRICLPTANPDMSLRCVHVSPWLICTLCIISTHFLLTGPYTSHDAYMFIHGWNAAYASIVVPHYLPAMHRVRSVWVMNHRMREMLNIARPPFCRYGTPLEFCTVVLFCNVIIYAQWAYVYSVKLKDWLYLHARNVNESVIFGYSEIAQHRRHSHRH